MEATLPPVLPAELERLIFEVASLSWPQSIPRFMLVAWRVKTWVEPLLYQILVVRDARPDWRDKGAYPLTIDGSVLLSLVRTKPPSFFERHVRHLLLFSYDMAAEDEADVLSACSNVEDLWWSGRSEATVPLINNMPLKRLHCSLNNLFDFHIDFTHRLFAWLTHLEIFDLPKVQPGGMDTDLWPAVTRLPHLTHLAFNDTTYLPMCLVLLRTWDSLMVLAILLYRRAYKGPILLEECGVTELAQDVRFVTMSCDEALEDWIMGAYTGIDYWSRAEGFIAKRKSGEINALHYFVDGKHATEMDGAESE
ncbi:hypothetical protein DFH06DRAFT_159944 [Mycena polygramma]|nr:hypothetical protein DFH06DRAFT_159944 [Mycena polygramma]